jgi:O-antigen/teichoic acid export membrane protein
MIKLISGLKAFNLALFDQALVSGVNFLTGVLLARALGAEEFGRFTLAWTVVIAANIFQQALVLDPLLNIGPKQSAQVARAYFATVIVHQSCLSAMLGIVAVIGFWAMGGLLGNNAAASPGLGDFCLPLVVAAIAFQAQEVFRKSFFVQNRLGAALINDAIRYVTQIVLLFAALYWYPAAIHSQQVMWIISGAAFLATLHGALSLGRLEWRPEVISTTTLGHWRFSRWMLPSAALQSFTASIFILVLGYLHGTETAGWLRAAQNLVAVAHIVFLGLEAIAQVRAARIYATSGFGSLGHFLLRFGLFGAAGVGFMLIGFCYFADPLLWLFYGSAYGGIAYLVYLWALQYFLYFLVMPLRLGLRATEATKSIFMTQLVVAAFAAVTVYPLVLSWGAVGAMVGPTIGYVIEFTCYAICLRRIGRHAPPPLPVVGGRSAPLSS